jgi:hypothetical protein
MTTQSLPSIPFRMARYALALLLGIGLSATALHAQPFNGNPGASHVAAKPAGDLAILLQKIVDLPELQPYYPLNPDKHFKPLVVMQHGVSFPTRIPVTHHSNPLIFKSKQETALEPAYFLFWRFDIAADKARVEFSYIYNAGSPAPSAQKAELVFDKADNNWSVTSSNIQTIKL